MNAPSPTVPGYARNVFKYKFMWLNIKQEGLRRFWSMFPLARVDFGAGFLSHSHMLLQKAYHANGLAKLGKVSELPDLLVAILAPKVAGLTKA